MDAEQETVSHPITVSEAFHLLDALRSRYRNTRSSSYRVFKETLDYAEAFCKMKNKSDADDFRASFAELGFVEEEIAALGSLLPQTSDEAKICVPSIVRLSEDAIDAAIDKIQSIS